MFNRNSGFMEWEVGTGSKKGLAWRDNKEASWIKQQCKINTNHT